MNRKQAIKEILEKNKDALIITTDGLISREVYALRKKGVFPMVGSMGLAPAIGLGIALNTKKKVLVLNGDGAYLMSAGTHYLIQYLFPKNLKHIILNNDSYGTTGGQKAARLWYCICQPDMINIKDNQEKPPRITGLKKIKEEFIKCLR